MTAQEWEKVQDLTLQAVNCRDCFFDCGVRPAFIDLAQPRWIGPNYRRSNPKTLIILLNPGAGQGNVADRLFRDRLHMFRDRKLDLADVLEPQKLDLLEWGRGKFKRFFLDGLNLELDRIAFANIAWCATQGNNYPVQMLRRCFNRHTSDLIAILGPDVVILGGSATHKFASEISTLSPNAKVIKTLHYAHREGSDREATELARVRQLLAPQSGARDAQQ